MVSTQQQLEMWVLTGPSEQAFGHLCACLELLADRWERAEALAFLRRKLVDWPAHACRLRRIHSSHPAWPLVRSLALRLDDWLWADDNFPAELYEDTCEDGVWDRELFCDLMYEPEFAGAVWNAIVDVVCDRGMGDLELVGVEEMSFPATRLLSAMSHLGSLSLENMLFSEPFPAMPSLRRLRLCDVSLDESFLHLRTRVSGLEELTLQARTEVGEVFPVEEMNALRRLHVERVRPRGWETLKALEELVWRHVPSAEGGVWMDEPGLTSLRRLQRLEWIGPGLTPALRGLRKLSELTHLTLGAMALDSLDFVRTLPALTHLDLSRVNYANALLSLPGAVSQYLEKKEGVLASREEIRKLWSLWGA